MLRTASLALAIAPLASGQTVDVVLRTGDALPGSGDIDFIHAVAVNDSGAWLVAVGVDVPSTQPDRGLVSSSGVVLSPGQSLGPFAGVLEDVTSIGLTALGEPFALLALSGVAANLNEGLYRGAQPLLYEGAQVAGQPVGTVYEQFLTLAVAGQHVQVCTDLRFPGAASPSNALLSYEHGLTLGAPQTVALQGDALPGGVGAFVGVRPDHGASAARQSIFGALTTVGERIYLDDVLLAEVGGATPVAGRTWAPSLSTMRGDVNGSGAHAFAARLDGDSASNVLLVHDGAKFVQTGDSLPAIAPFVLTRLTPRSFGEKDAVWLTDAGAVLWGAEWSDVDDNHGLFLDERLVAWEGMAVGPRTISALWAEYAISPNGRWLLFTAALAQPGQLTDIAVLRMDLAEGTSYCGPAQPNSSGAPATIFATAGSVVAGEPLLLGAQSLPLGELGYFLTSRSQGFVQPGNSQGVLCLGGPIGRFAQDLQVVDGAGQFTTLIDTGALPLTPLRSALAGETWRFQAWFSDFVLTPTSNFSDALEITF